MTTGYVIWSFEHQQWWRANRCGYTEHLDEAGRYTAAEAGHIVANAFIGEHVMLHEATATRFGAPTVPNLWAVVDSEALQNVNR